MKHHIIALTGFAGTGKDTVADILVTHCGFRKLAFADALRGEVANAYGVTLQLLSDRDTKELPTPALALSRAPFEFRSAVSYALGAAWANGEADHIPDVDAWLAAARSPRQIIQWWGTEYRRAQDPDYWVRAMRKRLTHCINVQRETRFVLTDTRFDNEALMVGSLGGELWQVTRPGVDASTTPEGTHSSATSGASLAPDTTISNAGTVHDLRNLVLGHWWALEAGLDGLRVEVTA